MGEEDNIIIIIVKKKNSKITWCANNIKKTWWKTTYPWRTRGSVRSRSPTPFQHGWVYHHSHQHQCWELTSQFESFSLGFAPCRRAWSLELLPWTPAKYIQYYIHTACKVDGLKLRRIRISTMMIWGLQRWARGCVALRKRLITKNWAMRSLEMWAKIRPKYLLSWCATRK